MKNEQPLISIIVPVYNVEKYLKKCLDSIVEQEYNDYELILINDGSTDGSQSIMEEYAAQYNNIILHNRENKGVLYTRVEGTQMAQGKYIMFVDSDDWIEKDTLKIFAEELSKDDFDIVKANHQKVNEEKIEKIENFKQEEIIYKNQINEKVYKKLMISDVFNTVWGQVIKKEIIDLKEIDTNICMGDDIIYNLACFRNTNKIKLISKCVYNYRQNDNSITHNVSKEKLISNLDDLFRVYRKLTQEMIKYSDNDNVKLSYIRYLKKANYGLFRIIRSYGLDDLIEEKTKEIIEKDITIEANKIIKISDIFFMKDFLFIWLILKGKRRQLLMLLNILAKVKK